MLVFRTLDIQILRKQDTQKTVWAQLHINPGTTSLASQRMGPKMKPIWSLSLKSSLLGTDHENYRQKVEGRGGEKPIFNRTLGPPLENNPEIPPSSRAEGLRLLHGLETNLEIGRASCRERV